MIVETNVFDVEETHYNCTVQVLKNTITGEKSVGWTERKPGTWLEVDGCMTICSECGAVGCRTRYCQNCGAKMENDG